MAKEKITATERHWDEVLSDNAALNHFAQCKDCIFREKVIVKDKEYGWDKGSCRMHIYPDSKPNAVYDNTGGCEYYEKEKRKK